MTRIEIPYTYITFVEYLSTKSTPGHVRLPRTLLITLYPHLLKNKSTAQIPEYLNGKKEDGTCPTPRVIPPLRYVEDS